MKTDAPKQMEYRILRTKGETSFPFYVTLLAGTVLLVAGVVILTGSYDRKWFGLVEAIFGVGALCQCMFMLSLAVKVSARGLRFRRLWQQTDVSWTDIISIYFFIQHDRFLDYGHIIGIEACGRRFRFIVGETHFQQLHELLMNHCPRATVIDADAKILHPPKSGDANWRRGQLHRYARRMVMNRALAAAFRSLIVVLLGILFARGTHAPEKVCLIGGVCGVIILALAGDVYLLVRRVRR